MSTARQPVPKDLAWEVYKNLTVQCEHFNELESKYRALASTWLLAAFAGIGFVLKDIHSEHGALYIAAIAGAAAIGIFLLWLMDLMVYHRLLTAAFAEQMMLENRYGWLPQVAHGMMSAHGGAGVVPKIVWFYIASYAVLIGIACVALVRGLAPAWDLPRQVAVIAVCFGVLGVAVGVSMYRSATTRTKEFDAFHDGVTG